ncbi:MAG: hypothetical protein CL666_06780 [Balneola sp.]|nr:hypothetical protein [Balneola sp.]|tara:strand:- start:4385 stop:6118 length:1734 start_codon:yes stop_codon:yes gene_type:complete
MGIIDRFSCIATLLVAFLVLTSCSTTSWEVVDENAMDVNEYQKIDSRYYMVSTNSVSPDQPIIHFDIRSINTYEYTERVLTERYIQRYRPRLGYVLLGAAGSGLSLYAAFSDQLLTRPSNPQKYALTGAGALLTTLSFLNMKPVGEPAKTGESRLLRKTGTAQEVDTTFARPYNVETPSIQITYGGRTLLEKTEWNFNDGRISINLAEELDAGVFNEDPDSKITVNAVYDSLSHIRSLEVASVFERFVVIENQITALRNQPENNSNNVLTELGEGSQLKLVSKEDEWFKVMYGISETWIAANDVRVIWRPSEFASDLSVIAIPNVPFGSVSVERNIPVLGRSNVDQAAFIVSNNKYEGELSERVYGERDAKLMEEYLIQGFGVRSGNLFKATNISTDQLLERAYSRMASTIRGDQHNIYVYINGYAKLVEDEVHLIGTGLNEDAEQLINLPRFFRALNNLSINNLIVFADLDFIEDTGSASDLEDLAQIVTSSNTAATVYFSSRPDQRSAIYSSTNGDQNRHSIFSYYLADALKQGKINTGEILNHLERNVPFTSRRLYDRPQNPLMFGNRDLQLLN